MNFTIYEMNKTFEKIVYILSKCLCVNVKQLKHFFEVINYLFYDSGKKKINF